MSSRRPFLNPAGRSSLTSLLFRRTSRTTKEISQALLEGLAFRDVAFPQLNYFPAAASQLADVSAVALDVAQQLRHPVVLAGLREPSVDAPFVLVPEAAVDEYRLPAGGEH
jgi:hypothetical protein